MRASVATLIVLVPLLCPATALAQTPTPSRSPVAEEPQIARTETALQADLVGEANPEGVMLVVGGFRRWIQEFDRTYGIPASYLQAGGMLGVNPAYAQASVYGEWMPALFAQLRLQYDLYTYFGANGGLLSFPSADARFGDKEVDARKDQEESGAGHRILFQPTLRAKVGPFILRNQTDAAYYLFPGSGPYFHELEYDTLLKNGDFLVANRTQALFEAWKGKQDEVLLAGPYYEVTHAGDADLTRQRAGGVLYWVPKENVWLLDRPRIYAQFGVNLQDRNRDHELFAVFGVGFDYDLLK